MVLANSGAHRVLAIAMMKNVWYSAFLCNLLIVIHELYGYYFSCYVDQTFAFLKLYLN